MKKITHQKTLKLYLSKIKQDRKLAKSDYKLILNKLELINYLRPLF